MGFHPTFSPTCPESRCTLYAVSLLDSLQSGDPRRLTDRPTGVRARSPVDVTSPVSPVRRRRELARSWTWLFGWKTHGAERQQTGAVPSRSKWFKANMAEIPFYTTMSLLGFPGSFSTELTFSNLFGQLPPSSWPGLGAHRAEFRCPQ